MVGSDDLKTEFLARRGKCRWAEMWDLLSNDQWYKHELAYWARIVVDRKDAPRHWRHDVAQEAALLLGRDLRSRPDLGFDIDRADRFFAWMRRIIIRHCLQGLRKVRKDYQDRGRAEIPVKPMDPEAAFMRRIDVATAVDQIDEPERTAVIMLGQRLTHEEMAAAMGMTYWEAYGACKRGLKRLRFLLAKAYGNEVG